MRFHISNAATGARYVADNTNGFCLAFTVDGIALQTTQAMGCLTDVFAFTLRRLDPGDTAIFDWDARRVTPCQSTLDCTQSGGMVYPYTVDVAEPVAAGRYRALVAATASLPANCNASDSFVSCDPANGPPALCVDGNPTSVDFVLPPSGNIDVPVALD